MLIKPLDCCAFSLTLSAQLLLWVLMKHMLQMIRRLEDPAELRQLLAEQGLADNLLLGFKDADLLDKGIRKLELLKLADVAALKQQTPLPPVLITALLRKFNPAALTAGPGGRPRAAIPDA